MRLYDPCCGTGTLLIEAAFRQEHRAPGLTRAFAMEQFSIFPAEECHQIRETCKADVLPTTFSALPDRTKTPKRSNWRGGMCVKRGWRAKSS